MIKQMALQDYEAVWELWGSTPGHQPHGGRGWPSGKGNRNGPGGGGPEPMEEKNTHKMALAAFRDKTAGNTFWEHRGAPFGRTYATETESAGLP